MAEITPINWEDKENSPELLAFLQQFGEKYYLSAEQINELRDKTNSLIVNRPTDISQKLDRGGYPGTAKDIVDSIHDPVDISGKLDKGGYIGNAKTLKEELELSSKIYTDEASQAVRNYTDTELSFKENLLNKSADFNTINDILYPTVKSVKTQLDTRIPLTEKGIANGVASLGADGKIPNSQIPALAISETFPINSQVAMLALSQADQGDVAVRLDLNKSFILRVAPSSVLENWQELLTPSDSVQSVNGQVGNVNLTTADLQDSTNRRYQTDNQKLFNDATSSIQTQFNGKQPNLGFTPEQAFSKNTAFNKNFGTTGGTVAEGNDARISNGQTAFSWGSHAGLYVPIGGNAVSASKWLAPVALTIGNTYKALDGSTNVSWSLSEIGAQPLLTNPITGTLTGGYLPKALSGSTLGNSIFFDDGTGAGIVNGGLRVRGASVIEASLHAGGSGGVNANGTKVFIHNDNGKTWALSSGINNETENDFAIYNWTDYSTAPLLRLSSGGAMKVNGTVQANTFIGDLNGTANRATTSDSLIDYVGGNRIFWGWNGSRVTFKVNAVDIGAKLPMDLQGTADNAITWGGTTYTPSEQGDPIIYMMSYSTSSNTWKPTSAGLLKTFLGIGGFDPANYYPKTGGILNGNIVFDENRFIQFRSGGDGTALLAPTSHLVGGGSARDLNAYVYGDNPFAIWTSGVKRFEINGTGGASLFGTLGLSGNLTAETYISTPLLSLRGGGAPYLQFLSESGGRRAYIQHDGGNLVLDADIGGITLNKSTGVVGNFNASGQIDANTIVTNMAVSAAFSARSSAPYFEFRNASNSQMGYIQHNGAGIQIVTGGGPVSVSNTLSVAGTVTASGGFFNSDERLKDIVKRDGDVVHFKWKDKRDEKTHIGYIAQEVQKTNPDQVQEDKDGFLSVNYVELLVAEIQSLKKEIKLMKGGSYGI